MSGLIMSGGFWALCLVKINVMCDNAATYVVPFLSQLVYLWNIFLRTLNLT